MEHIPSTKAEQLHHYLHTESGIWSGLLTHLVLKAIQR